MRLECGQSIALRPPATHDAASIAKLANDRSVWINLRDAMPHPYSLQDAVGWIESTLEQDPIVTFAIECEGEAIGGIGLVPGTDIERRSAELGYWLGTSYWGRGIASAAVTRICRYAFQELRLVRVFATPMTHNVASIRVLEKAGFGREGVMRACYVKDGLVRDAALYARIDDSHAQRPAGSG
ncbi:MAG TPA: GNAT family N-acetyltransferase [Candidatus Tumulicola sp.]|jgi:RimJ/RimL family protein N-acetyltransferase